MLAQEEEAPGLQGKSAPVAPVSDMLVVGEHSIRIHKPSERVWINGEVVSLSASEYHLLTILAENADRVLSHDELLDLLLVHEHGLSLEGLRVLIWRLRQKLTPPGETSRHLRTVRGFGYVLVS